MSCKPHIIKTVGRIFLLTGGIALSVSQMSGKGLLDHWATTFETQAGAGYDTNILGLRNDETSDGFATASQSINVARHNSLTALSFQGDISTTRYFSEDDADFVDGGFAINAAYPDTKIDVTFWNAALFWNRNSQVNLNSGQRIQPMIYGGRAGGEWLLSPKTGFVGMVQATTTDRSRDGFSTSRSLKLRSGLSRAWGPEKRWNLEYGLTLGDTDSGSGSESTINYFGVRGRGNLSPKIKGDVFVGVRNSKFTGLNNFSDTGPNASVDITWFASPQTTAVLSFESEYDFAANGNIELRTSGNFRIKRKLGKGLSYGLNVERSNSSYEHELNAANWDDSFWRLEGSLDYSFTRRFFIRLSADILASDSSIEGYDIDRNVFSLESGLRY